MIHQLILIVCGLLSFPLVSTGQESIKLFSGYSLDGWEITDLEGHGKVYIADSCIILGTGNNITGINWINEFPTTNYEVTLEAKRIEGNDFFCGMTFPVKSSFLTLVLGGWGGSFVGLSNIDGYDAANNFTGLIRGFESNYFYNIRLKVTNEKIEAWIGDDKIVDLIIGSHSLSLRMEMELSVPFGIATYKTTSAIRNIKLDRIRE